MLTTVYMIVRGARRFPGIRPQSVYIIYVSNCIYETYDLGKTLILGGGFRTFAGPPTISNGRTTVSKTVALCTIRSSLLCRIILDRIVCKSLTLQVLNIWRRGRDSDSLHMKKRRNLLILHFAV
jgi:hypothetical protein